VTASRATTVLPAGNASPEDVHFPYWNLLQPVKLFRFGCTKDEFAQGEASQREHEMDYSRHNKNHGIILFSVLIILVSLTLVALTLTQRNTMDEMMSAAQRDSANAIAISESGIEAGFALVEQNYILGQVIKDELYQLPGGVLSQDTISGGNYLVTVIDGVPNDGIATLNSVGDFNGSVREIEIVLDMLRPGNAAFAILTSSDINSLDGSAEVNGPHADVHSNSDVEVGNLNSPGVDGVVSASGTVTAHDPSDIAGGTVDGAALVEIPHVYPPEYLQYATAIFTGDCKVMSPGGAELADLSGSATWHGWKCRPGVDWTLGANPADGYLSAFYYIHGNVKINSGPDTEWMVTFVAEGNIEISGNPDFVPFGSLPSNDTGDAEANEILFLAGNDIDLRGTAGALTSGIIAAHMEVAMQGNVTHTGTVLAENGLHGMGQEVTTGQVTTDIVSANSFSGNMVINGTGSGLGTIKELTATAWRELVF
jgi:hypothetical protein